MWKKILDKHCWNTVCHPVGETKGEAKMCKLCRYRPEGFLQTFVAYHSFDAPDAEPPDHDCVSHGAPGAPRVGVVDWASPDSKLACTNETSVSSEAPPTEEVYTYDAASVTAAHPPISTSEAGTITDVCNSANLPEVEILSLIEEQIPKYRLRADTITAFRGYENEDWIQTPLIPLDEDLALTDEQIEETLKYFILCSERVTQMTKTFNDIEAVNRLLEEKERDLELAARIGQTLLEKNKELTAKNEILDEHLHQANDKVNQLKHDLSMKDELLRFYCQDLENAETESCDDTPIEKSFNLSGVDLGALQTRVLSLEEDNLHLRLETVQLKSHTENYEEKEQKLVTDCVDQLNEINEQLEALSDELIKKCEENSKQKEEITNLLAQIVEQQKKCRTQTIENMELSKHLDAAQSSQRCLTKEVTMLQDRYDELFELLEEAQEELKILRSKRKPHAVRSHYMSTPYLPSDSLASELQTSLKGELDYPKGYSPTDRKAHTWKIFETVKAAKKSSERRATSRNSLTVPGSISQSGGDSLESAPSSVRSSLYLSDGESGLSDGYSADIDSLLGSNTNLGRPGIPGSNDLETALRKLSMRRANELNEQDFFEDQRKRAEARRERSGSDESRESRFEIDGATGCSSPPPPCWTPDSLMSTGSGISGLSNMSGTSSHTHYKLPEKLQIVKPMEGSVMLRRWQMLATPHMGGLFEERPGIITKGEKKLDTETFNLSDLEEDDDALTCPSKRVDDSGSVYTFTDSMVMHPSDHSLSLTSSSSRARMSSLPGSTPIRVDKKKNGGTSSNYGMSLGLAAILHERGMNSKPEQGIGLRINPPSPLKPSSELVDSSYDSMNTSTTNSVSTVPESLTPMVLAPPPPRSNSSDNVERVAMKDGESARSFIDRLKNKSRSLYSIWNTTWSGSQDSDASSSVDGPTAGALSKTTSNTSLVSASSLEPITTVKGTAPSGGNVQNQKASERSNMRTSPIAPGMGVLGSLTNFRKSGLL